MHRTLSFLLALVAVALWPAAARAIPPGGPSENRQGATVTLEAKVVAPDSAVTFHGTGFTPGEVVNVKVDDGLVLPATPAAGGPDVFATLTADGDGEIDGAVDLSAAQSRFDAELATGKHLLRFLSTVPAPRSIHADFAVKAAPLPSAAPSAGGAAFIGPAADLPVAYMAGHAYDDIPKLVAGSVVPYRITGFPAGATVSIKVNDGAVPAPGVANGVFGTVTTDATGAASGTIAVPTSTPGTYWLRFLAAGGYTVFAPYAVVASDGRDLQLTTPTPAPGSLLGLSGSGLLRVPDDYWPANDDGGQTVHARIDGTGAPVAFHASGGTLNGTLRLPADLALGAHTLVLYVGFVEQADGPQAVFVRDFAVTPGGSDGPVDPTPTPTPPVATPTPTPTPPIAVKPAAIKSKALKLKGRTFSLTLTPGERRATFAIQVRTASKVRVGKQRKLVTLAKRARYTLPAGGKSRTVKLKLTAAGRSVLRSRRSVKVRVRLVPSSGRVIARTLTLRR